MAEIELQRRYPDSRPEDITDAYMRGVEVGRSLGRPTCKVIEYEHTGTLVCSECGAIQPDDYTVYWCWSCGAKVAD